MRGGVLFFADSWHLSRFGEKREVKVVCLVHDREEREVRRK